jgi:hypothetical protein
MISSPGWLRSTTSSSARFVAAVRDSSAARWRRTIYRATSWHLKSLTVDVVKSTAS